MCFVHFMRGLYYQNVFAIIHKKSSRENFGAETKRLLTFYNRGLLVNALLELFTFVPIRAANSFG